MSDHHRRGAENAESNTASVTEPGDELTRHVIGAAIEVHRRLGPGLLESAYQRCLAFELKHQSIAFETEVVLPVQYRDQLVDCCYRMDFVIEKMLIVEVKAVAKHEPIFDAQLLTYMRLSGLPLGLILNFNAPTMREGISRKVLTHSAPSASLR